MLYIVEVRRIGADLAAYMAEMRNWLYHHGVSPSEFEHSSGGPGITFRVGFRREDDAIAFARAIGGRVNNGLDPDGAALWQIGKPRD